MIRFQYILTISILLAFTACQGDTSVKETAEAVKKASEQPKKVVKELKSEPIEFSEQQKKDAGDAVLKEFYVEEDKSGEEPKKATSKPNKTKESVKEDKKVAATAKPKAIAKKSPKMSFTNNTHAFGIIKPGEVIEHKFEFTNTGKSDLVITDAKATCGCTQPSFPFVPIPPGEKGYIGVKYDSTGKLGAQKPTVTLTTNASPKTQKVYLEGMVISQLSKN